MSDERQTIDKAWKSISTGTGVHHEKSQNVIYGDIKNSRPWKNSSEMKELERDSVPSQILAYNSKKQES